MDNFQDKKQSEQESRIRQAKRTRLVKNVLWIAIPAAILGVGVFWLIRSSGTISPGGPGVFYPEQGRRHVALGTAFDYNSNPPTSGPHFASPEEWGVYDKEIPDQVLIHNLEHGGVWIAYRPGINQETVKKLEAIAKDYGRKVIMAPRAANDADIALAAWTHLDKFSSGEFSEERVRDFIKAYRNKGPEFVP